MIELEVTYRFACDLPGCRMIRTFPRTQGVLHDLMAKARSEGWSISNINRGPRKGQRTCRCPEHAWLWTRRRGGRNVGQLLPEYAEGVA